MRGISKSGMELEFMKVDYADPRQAQDLVTMLDLYARDPMGGSAGLSEFAKMHLPSSLGSIPGAFSFLGYWGDRPVALANCFEGFSTFKCQPLVNIHDLVVRADFRGRGVGQRLLAAVEQEAIFRGCCKLTLEVLEGNQVARGAYERFGFQGYELDPQAGKALFLEKNL